MRPKIWCKTLHQIHASNFPNLMQNFLCIKFFRAGQSFESGEKFTFLPLKLRFYQIRFIFDSNDVSMSCWHHLTSFDAHHKGCSKLRRSAMKHFNFKYTSRSLTIDRTGGVTEVQYCTTDSHSTIISLLLGTRSVPRSPVLYFGLHNATNTHKAFEYVQYCLLLTHTVPKKRSYSVPGVYPSTLDCTDLHCTVP